MDRPGAPVAAEAAATGQAPATGPAELRRILDLRVRHGDARRSRRRDRVGTRAEPQRTGVGPCFGTRPLHQRRAPLERRAVLHVHGRAPLGQVLDGGMAWRPRAHLDHRCHRVRSYRSSPASPATCFRPTSTRSGSRSKARMRSMPWESAPGSTSPTSGRCSAGTSRCFPWPSEAIVALHVLLVRVHGVVPPIDATEADDQVIRAGNESEDRAMKASASMSWRAGTTSPAGPGAGASVTTTSSKRSRSDSSWYVLAVGLVACWLARRPRRHAPGLG